jgi:Mrp family chromosome partitioning ATPase
VSGLRVLTSGPIPPNPAELLGSGPFKRRLDELKELADVVLFDSPALLAVADATIVGGLCSGVVLVVDGSGTRSELVRQGKATLDQIGLKILGVVLTRVTAPSSAPDKYYSRTAARPGFGSALRRVAGAWTSLFDLHH